MDTGLDLLKADSNKAVHKTGEFFGNKVADTVTNLNDNRIVKTYKQTCKLTNQVKTRRDYLPKAVIDAYNIIINEKKCHDQSIDSDIKRYEEIWKSTTGQGEDYTAGCLLDYDHIKNHYRLIVVDLSRQKELDVDLKAIQQIEFVG